MTVEPWHYQITGALGIGVKMLGEVPLEGAPEKHKNDPEVVAAANALRGIPLHGVIPAVETGFGKTVMGGLAALIMAKWHLAKHDAGNLIHKPSFLVALLSPQLSHVDAYLQEYNTPHSFSQLIYSMSSARKNNSELQDKMTSY